MFKILENYSKRPFFVWLFLLIWGFLIYSNTFEASFHLDDYHWISDNPSIRNLSNIKAIWEFLPTRFLGNLSFALNYAFARSEVYSYHLLNILIHIFTSFFVYLLVAVTFKTPKMKADSLGQDSKLIAFFAALIFLSHPIQTQAVTYIVQRFTSLCSMFYIGSIFFYVKARLKKKWEIYFLSLGFAICSMLTKETAFTLPIIILFYELMFFEKNRKRILYIAPFLLTLVLIPTLRFFHMKQINEDLLSIASETTAISRNEYFLTQLNVVRTYLRLLFLPINQNIEYDYPISNNLLDPSTSVSLGLHLSLILFGIIFYKRWRVISFSIFWFYVVLSVESSVIPINDVIFEHRVYLSLFILAVFLPVFFKKFFKTITLFNSFLILVIIIFSTITFQRNRVWASEISLLEDSYKKSSGTKSIQNLAKAYIDIGKFKEAIPLLHEAIERSESNLHEIGNKPLFLYNLGIAYKMTGDEELAISVLNEAVKIQSTFAQAWALMGRIYQDSGRSSKALLCYKKSISINPKNPTVYEFLASFYHQRGNNKKVKENLNKALELQGLNYNSVTNPAK